MKLPKIGPGILVTAAFIGPGTVITASLAGANYGYALIWALIFSVIATIILQEMTARLGLVTQKGLGENIRATITNPFLRLLAASLVVGAIVIGNAAYQGGNISGASIGLTGLFGQMISVSESGLSFWPVLIGTLAFIVLWQGQYRLIEKSLVFLVILLSLAFVTTFILTKPNFAELFKGMFIPYLPEGATLTVIALIGTTIVPYNLFLHAGGVAQKWKSIDDLGKARVDLYITIPFGGLVSIAIVSTAAAAFFGQQIALESAADLAPALAPLFGDGAKYFMAAGLFAAGISSAITAPLASSYALCGILNLKPDLKSNHFKLIWLTILVMGTALASANYKPVSIIWFAQVANGLLLPIICIFLLWVMNSPILGENRNQLRHNILGFLILMVTLMLSGRSLSSAFGLI